MVDGLGMFHGILDLDHEKFVRIQLDKKITDGGWNRHDVHVGNDVEMISHRTSCMN